MDYASEDLRNEHEGILFGLNLFWIKWWRSLGAAAPLPWMIMQMVEFLKLFADKCHHGKEEGLFFPALEQAGIPKKTGRSARCLSSMNWAVSISRK